VLPAITLDVEPTDAGLQGFSEQLAAFAHNHGLPETVASRFVAVASDVTDIVAGTLDAPPVGRLQADADIGLDDVQLVLIARDHRLLDVYASLRPRLDRLASRCDAFAAQLTPNAELQVWACFRLVNGAGA
jgi:hypothetical protein